MRSMWFWMVAAALAMGCTTTRKCGAEGNGDVKGECDDGDLGAVAPDSGVSTGGDCLVQVSTGECFAEASYQAQQWRVQCSSQGCQCTRSTSDGAPQTTSIDVQVNCSGDPSQARFTLRNVLSTCGAPDACRSTSP